jgi:alkanesulfonate monooxygenase SsuD/methylene tetrahydromethanopterin reductase-like flavin-dependent oxidoreductase (luciferase family)
MKLGIFLMGSKDSSYFDIVDQVVEADAIGFDGVWLAERHFASGDLLFPSPMLAAAYLAAKTQRIRVGLAARVLPFHHPLHVAADACTLDILSRGRLDLGLSRGSMDEAPHAAFGAPRDEARQRFDEALEVLRLFFRGRPFSFKGRYYDLSDVVPSPAPMQRPHPPLYMVANNPLSLDAAADQGFPVFMNGAMRLADLEHAMARYRARRDAAARRSNALSTVEPVDIPVNRFVFVGESRAHAHRVMREPFREFLERRAPDLRAYLTARLGERAASFDSLAREICIFDDPEGCAARLLELSDRVGIRHVLCTFNLISLDHRLALSSMRRFAAEVVPLIEEQEAISLAPASAAPRSMVRVVGDAGRPIERVGALRAAG